MELIVTAPRTALATLLLSRAETVAARGGDARVVVNPGLQPPNTLLHDGRAWKRYGPVRILTETRAAMRRASRADFLVHASYVFAGAGDADVQVGRTLRPLIAAALEAEHLVLNGSTPACVVRLGYLYGPESRNLRAYRRAFRIGRPYWAGPTDCRQHFLHTEDAVSALVAAARERPKGALLAATDNQPVSFATFMDQFARLVGNPLPLHIPGVARPLSRVIIGAEHMEAVALSTASIPLPQRPLGFTPQYAGYRSGLRSVLAAWSSA